VARLPEVQLTLFGDGPQHAGLAALAAELGVAERVTLVKRIENAELCRQLPEFDVFAARSDYFEISKSVLEPLLTGLPVVHNRRPGAQVPELQGDFACLVEPTEAGYFEALARLLADDAAREALGRAAYAHAQARWAPERTEAKYAEVHRRYMRAVV
jgi:glycosyltransferase involved in cell wall biosynthesis